MLRDPSICRGPDGTFHLVFTAGWTEKGFGYASSPDLIHWSPQRYIKVMDHEPTTMNAWAPEVSYDETSHTFVVCWASTIPARYPGDELHPLKRNHRMYYSTTRDFQTWTPTKVLFDPGYSVIDGVLVERPGGQEGFALVFKDERRPMRRLRVAFSSQRFGPFGDVSEPFTAELTEGPSVLRLGDRWIVYYDNYSRDTYGAAETRDFKTWTDVSDRVSFPRGHKHGTVLVVPAAIVEGLKQFAAAAGDK
jgi:hypothetical protein